MFLNGPDEIQNVTTKSHFSIFTVPEEVDFPKLPKSITISPNEKNTITIDEVRNVEEIVRTKQISSITIVVNSADHMTESAQNCFLKLLEEPGNQVHFAFFVRKSQKLLPTIRSRAHNYVLRSENKISTPPKSTPETIALAKKYISATPRDLAAISKDLAKDREQALALLDASIELIYKSYFKTGNQKFLEILQKLLKTQDAISKNGHIRLQLVAGMI